MGCGEVFGVGLVDGWRGGWKWLGKLRCKMGEGVDGREGRFG